MASKSKEGKKYLIYSLLTRIYSVLYLGQLKEQEAALALLKGPRSSSSKADSGIGVIEDSSSPNSAERKEISKYPSSK